MEAEEKFKGQICDATVVMHRKCFIYSNLPVPKSARAFIVQTII